MISLFHEREVDSLKPAATFLKDHAIHFDEKKKMWVVHNMYCYQSLYKLLVDEGIFCLLEWPYGIKQETMFSLEHSSNFHELGLVKNQ